MNRQLASKYKTQVRLAYHNQHREIPWAEPSRRGGYNERGNRNPQRHSNMPVALSCPIRVPGIDDRSNHSEDVWGRR